MEKAPVFLLCNKNGGSGMYKGGFNMASYTQHYQLHQWEPSDNFLRTDFNTNLEKIDTALGQNCRVIHGSYTGNGKASQAIALSEKPQALMVFQDGMTNDGNLIYGGAVFPGVANTAVTITSQGFTVKGNGDGSGSRPMANVSATVYQYLAFYWNA